MAEAVGSLVSTVLRRVRDPSAMAHPRADAVTVLDHAQRLVNAAIDQVYATTTFSTTPKRVFYSINDLASAALQIQDVRDGGRSLVNLKEWRHLFLYDRDWHRFVGPRPECFAQIGTDLLILFPATELSMSLDLIYTKLTGNLVGSPTSDESAATDLPDDLHAPMLDLAEAVLSLRQREFDALTHALERLVGLVQRYKRMA